MDWGIVFLVVLGLFVIMVIFTIIFDKVIKPRIIKKRKDRQEKKGE